MKTLLLIACLISTQTVAQGVQPIDMMGQPLLYLKDGKVSACGLRITGVHVQSSNFVSTIDVSITVEQAGYAFVKVISGDGAPQNIGTPSFRNYKVADGWIKAPGNQATTPINNKTLSGDDGKSMLYVTSIDAALAIFKAQSEKKPINIGVKREGETNTRIYSGVAVFTEPETQQFMQCLQEFISNTK